MESILEAQQSMQHIFRHLPIFCLILLFASCQSDSVDKAPVSCRLETYRIVGVSTRTIRYNSDNLPYTVTLFDDQAKALLSVDTLKYDIQKRLVKVRNFRGGSVFRDFTFQYNGNNPYPSGYIQTSYTGTFANDFAYGLTFNATGQLTWSGSNAAVFSTNEKTLTYDASGNIDKITERMTGSPYSYLTLQKSTVDDKPTPWSSSLPLKLFSFIRLGFWDAFSTHNVTSGVIASSVNITGNNPPVVETVNSSTTYNYNEHGYPINLTEKRPTTTYELSFTYQCP
jgi:hypothetical protein